MATGRLSPRPLFHLASEILHFHRFQEKAGICTKSPEARFPALSHTLAEFRRRRRLDRDAVGYGDCESSARFLSRLEHASRGTFGAPELEDQSPMVYQKE